jgi:hypothetical protein
MTYTKVLRKKSMIKGSMMGLLMYKKIFMVENNFLLKSELENEFFYPGIQLHVFCMENTYFS